MKLQMQKRTLTVAGLVTMLSLVLTATGCGSDLKQQNEHLLSVIAAKDKAAQLYGDICAATNGDQAASLASQMTKALQDVGVDPAAFPLQPKPCVRTAFQKQAAQTLAALRNLHRDDKKAQDLAEAYRNCMRRADKTVPPSTERELALQVARNKKENAVATEQAHGVRSRSNSARARRLSARAR